MFIIHIVRTGIIREVMGITGTMIMTGDIPFMIMTNLRNIWKRKQNRSFGNFCTDYGPIGLVWFDRGMYNPEQALEFIDLIRNLQPSTLINGRVGNYDQEFLGDYQSMGDNGMPPGGLDEYWETPITLNRTWGFSKFDTLWKSPEAVILQFVAAVSRGGNYLLNIGPKGDGEIPEVNFRDF